MVDKGPGQVTFPPPLPHCQHADDEQHEHQRYAYYAKPNLATVLETQILRSKRTTGASDQADETTEQGALLFFTQPAYRGSRHLASHLLLGAALDVAWAHGLLARGHSSTALCSRLVTHGTLTDPHVQVAIRHVVVMRPQ
jgi:hypothetical protein